MTKTYLVKTRELIERHFFIEADQPPMNEDQLQNAKCVHTKLIGQEIEEVSEATDDAE
ncbi:MAG: hypothetical protein AAFW60_00500 [Pseudomonadota bacterium]